MKKYALAAAGHAGLAGIAFSDAEIPEPRPGQIRVRIRAASLNYRDLVVARQGGLARPGTVPLSDGAGEVVALGQGVSRFKVGDRVAGCFFQNWESGPIGAEVFLAALGGTMDGVLAEYCVFDERAAVHVPHCLSFEEAATLPCAAVTAWNALVEVGDVKPGQTVLLLGTGGVSIFALQFARVLGARVLITSSSDQKLERARDLGAHHTINYRTTPDWEKEVWRLTDKRGVDLVLEVGGAGTLPRSLRAVRTGGTVALIGVLTGNSEINPMPVLHKVMRLQGVYVGSTQMFRDMLAATELHRIIPIIDHVFPFENALDAYHHLESAAHFGKIVIGLPPAT